MRSGIAWLTTVLLFISFAGFNLYQSLLGVASCGCFGKVEVHPALALTLDLVVLGSLTLAAWKERTAHSLREWVVADLDFSAARAATIVGGTLVFLALLFGAAVWKYGSPRQALASWMIC